MFLTQWDIVLLLLLLLLNLENVVSDARDILAPVALPWETVWQEKLASPARLLLIRVL